MAGNFLNLQLMYPQRSGTKIVYSIFAFWLLLFAAGAKDMAYADGGINPALTKTWTLRAGAFSQDLSVDATKYLTGTAASASVSLDSLGMENWYVSPALYARWRMSDNWRLELGYFGTDVDGRRAVNEQITFGNRTTAIGASVATSLDANIYFANLGYSFLKNDQLELGVRFGTYIFDITAGINASAYVGGAASSASKEASLIAPLPNLGLFGTYALTDRFNIQGSFGYIGASYENWSGDSLSFTALAEYWLSDRFAIGLGYQYLDINIEHKGSTFEDKVDVTWQGPTIYGTLAF